jgi:glycosyltransferase involved in cell wall biosynthesis
VIGSPPRVSVLMAAHDAERFLRPALESVLRQTMTDLELVVVDDGSSDGTAEILASIDDPRLVIVRNEERLGLAASLNHALDRARGSHVARLDADDIALPGRLERQVERMREQPELGVVGSAILEIDDAGRAGVVHAMPLSPAAVRWAALFSSPFYHPTVLLDRELLDRHALRYDTSYPESEDYELWARLLQVADGANVPEPLVLYRVHAAQATQRRRGLQREFQLQVARREISLVAPGLDERAAELAWRIGAHEPVDASILDEAADAFVELLARFEGRAGGDREVREGAARTLARWALTTPGGSSAGMLRAALALDPALPLHVVTRRRRRRALTGEARPEAERYLASLSRSEGDAIRVTVVSPEPAPYRAPLFDLIEAHPEIDLTVAYAAETLAGRSWNVELRHRSVFLRGFRLPLVSRLVHHDYVVNTDVARVLRESRPDVVVAAGWSTFACQAAILWCRRNRVPYVLQVESHDAGPRSGWRRTVKGAVVPRVVRGAAAVLVTGTLARDSMLERGADPSRIGLFAVTVDVEGLGARADELRSSRDHLRAASGIGADDVAVVSVARLAPEKGLDTLVRAVAAAGDERLVLVLVGDGPERDRLESLGSEHGVRLVLAGDRPWERIVESYVSADIFALLSEREPWGVVVNEAAACGLPLVLSDRVGAAADLLRDGENGFLVADGDAAAAAAAVCRLADDPALRSSQGARSRELVAGWGYGPSVDGVVDAVRDAVARGRRR